MIPWTLLRPHAGPHFSTSALQHVSTTLQFFPALTDTTQYGTRVDERANACTRRAKQQRVPRRDRQASQQQRRTRDARMVLRSWSVKS